MTFDIEPSMIFSAWFPFSDLSKEKKRPVLALSDIDKNGDVRVAFITKTPADEDQGFALNKNDFVNETLKYQSYIRIDKTFNLHISRIEKPVTQLNEQCYEKVLRKLIAFDIPNLAKVKYKEQSFIPEKSVIPPSGKLMGETELQYMVEASLDGWLTTGRFNDQFEKELAEFESQLKIVIDQSRLPSLGSGVLGWPLMRTLGSALSSESSHRARALVYLLAATNVAALSESPRGARSLERVIDEPGVVAAYILDPSYVPPEDAFSARAPVVDRRPPAGSRAFPVHTAFDSVQCARVYSIDRHRPIFAEVHR